MNINKFSLFAVILFAVLATGCSVKYSLSGASISPLAKTVSIAYFPNNATMVAPILSSTLTDGLQDRFARQTRLSVVREGGDLAFEGEITNYTSTPSSITSTGGIGGTEGASTNRLTITVKVRFVNSIDPQWNYDRSFSQFKDYPVSQTLQAAEASLIPDIVELLIEDIFNAAVANW